MSSIWMKCNGVDDAVVPREGLEMYARPCVAKANCVVVTSRNDVATLRRERGGVHCPRMTLYCMYACGP